MKYIEKYNRYIDNDYVIYRKNKDGKLVQVKPSVSKIGYQFICYAPKKTVYVHRLVYEAFKGEIPEGMEIDHIDRNKLNNKPDNLRVVTHIENMNNRGNFMQGYHRYHHSEETRRKIGEANKGTKSTNGMTWKLVNGKRVYSKRLSLNNK